MNKKTTESIIHLHNDKLKQCDTKSQNKISCLYCRRIVEVS